MLFILLILTLKDLNTMLYNYIKNNPIVTSKIFYFCHNALMNLSHSSMSESPAISLRRSFLFL